MRALTLAASLFLMATPLLGQTGEAPRVHSLGQPEIWKWSAGGGLGGLLTGDTPISGEARVGVYRDVVNPVASLAGVQLDGYLGLGEGHVSPGVRARLVSPFARFGLGVDWNYGDGAGFLLSINHPLRRGGLFHDGSTLRLDWVPSRSALTIGFEKPVVRRIPQGRTRPYRDHVDVSASHATSPGRPPALTYLAPVSPDAGAIGRLTVLFLDHDGHDHAAADDSVRRYLAGIAQSLAGGPAMSSEAIVRRYHANIDRAFPSVAVANVARGILLDEVLLPWDRLLGQIKERAVLDAFSARAQHTFARALADRADITPPQAASAAAVFAEWLTIIAQNHDALRAQWQDSRFVFLPLQYALLPEQHDTQAELDALIEKAVAGEFTDGNFVSYAINEQYQYQLSRTIREAQDYHVLWTHDVRGFDDQKQPDEMAFRQVLHSYLQALTDRVRAYDSAGRMPVYIILLDQWFYEVNRGRLWMNLLEDPLGYRLHLPKGYSAWEDSIASAQSALRQAVAASARIQADRQRFGDAWLHSIVRVQVNITNPPDPTFWSRHVLRFVPLPDNMMRDHRKLVFYDITEADPYRGEALFTGAGVAEHYASLSWEDRTLVVRGPALLGLKTAARALLQLQGMSADKIPVPLQPHAFAADYNARIVHVPQNDQMPLRALAVQNGIGFNDKNVNVAKAILYTLMPAGSVIKIPDSLWNSMFWGGALCGAALRGARVLIIAPAMANSPVQKTTPFSRGQEFASRMLTARVALDSAITSAGGLLRIGIYAPAFQVTDIPAKLRAIKQTFEQQPWLRELFGFPPSVYASLADLTAAFGNLKMTTSRAPEFEFDPTPKLHLKANFFASREAWTLMTRPEWGAFTWEYTQQRVAQVQSRMAAVGSFENIPEPFIDVGGAVVADWLAGLAPAVRERVVFYTIMGSQNQNYRSMVIDGEVAFVVSGWPSVIPYLDFISLVGQSRWPTGPDELAPLLPPQSARAWRLARWAKLTS